MRKRPDGFLSKENIDHDGEIFNYIGELHDYLWAFSRLAFPSAQGDLRKVLDLALETSRRQKQDSEKLLSELVTTIGAYIGRRRK